MSRGKVTLTTNYKHRLCDSVQKGSTEHGKVRKKASTQKVHLKDLHSYTSPVLLWTSGSQQSRAITQLLGQLHYSSVNPPDILPVWTASYSLPGTVLSWAGGNGDKTNMALVLMKVTF